MTGQSFWGDAAAPDGAESAVAAIAPPEGSEFELESASEAPASTVNCCSAPGFALASDAPASEAASRALPVSGAAGGGTGTALNGG